MRIGVRQAQRAQRAGTGQETGFRILGVEPHFDGMAVLADVLLRQRQGLAGGHAQLPFHQVQPGHHLGDGVFHLQAGVDLHEIEAAGGIDDEFDGAGIGVIDRARRLHRRGAHRRAQVRGEEGRGRFLQHLLVAPLRRAFAFVEVQRVAVRVGEHLDLDVARRFDVTLQQHAVAAERALRLALAAFEVRQELVRRTHDAHALAAAAVRGLDHQRIADAVGFALQCFRRLVLPGVAGDHRHAGGLHQLLGSCLAAHPAHGRGGRADEGQTGRGHGVGEVRVLAEEAVAGMHRLRARRPRDFDDRIAAQITVRRPRPADGPGLVRLAHVLRVGVGLRIHGHGADAEAPRRADDAAGDFAAVGDEDLPEHGGAALKPSPSRGGFGWGWVSPCGRGIPDHVHHSFDVLENLIVPESQDNESGLLQRSCAPGIVIRGFGMLAPIDLDDDPPFQACEVQDVVAEGMLPAKLRSVDSPAAKV